jgi:mRNA interferase YafQ
MNQLKRVMMLIITNDGPLAAQWRDHGLVGDWKDHRECHVGGDFLVIYRFQGSGTNASVVFVRAGTHSELFE